MIQARQYDHALEEVERIRQFAPDFVGVDISTIHIMLGQHEEAQLELIAVAEQCGDPCDWWREALERGWTEDGWEGSVRAFLEVATETEGTSRLTIAANYVRLGETDEAFAWLERGYRERDPHMVIRLTTSPMLDPLRSDPRFDDLLRRIGFPES